MPSDILFVHALSPLHVGSGSSVDVIDLPLVRERSTGYPYVPGSSVKGALRALVAARNDRTAEDRLFGFRKRREDEDDRNTFAGALAIADARLLLLPVRSDRGVFALVTAALPLRRFLRAVAEAKAADEDAVHALHQLVERAAQMTDDSAALVSDRPPSVLAGGDGGKVTLEELEAEVSPDPLVARLGKLLAKVLLPEGEDDYVSPRLCVVDDEAFAHFARHATEVCARIRIDENTRTVKSGALWNEENLPAESVLFSLVHSFGSRGAGQAMSAREALDAVWNGKRHQLHTFGGKETTGHGRVRLSRAAGKE